MDNPKAPKKTWHQFQASHGRTYGTRPAQAFHQREHQQQQAKKSSNVNFETSDRTKQNIMRYVYPINNSGSKQLVLGCNPQVDFRPTITLRKPGYKGIDLSHEGSAKLIAQIQTIQEYFANDFNDNDLQPIELQPGELIEFGYFAGKKAIFVKKQEDDSKVGCMILTGNSVHFMADIYDLLKYIFEELTVNSIEIKRLYDALVVKLNQQPDIKKDLIRTLGPDEITFNSANCSLDYLRAFLELRKYCELELLA
jgi:hypothetical protein